MTTMRILRAGSGPRGAPAPRFGPRPLALAVIAVAGLALSGCQSSGACNSCGPTLGSPCNWFRNMSQRMFQPRPAASGACCGGESIGEAPITEFGAAPAVVAPSGTLGPAPTKIVPAEPILSPTDPGATSSSKSGAGKTSYNAYQQRNRSGRNLTRAFDSAPDPTPGSGQGSALTQAADPLDNMPPLPLPERLTSGEGVAAPAPPASTKPEAKSTTAAPASEKAPPEATNPPAPPAAAQASPGPRRFVSLEPKLAGGSLPTPAGLDWLRDKGYKTFLDLRESKEVQPSFIADVTNRGMRYVALPVSAKTLDADHISRFQFELSLAEARPLYFCDADGSRSGALWYVRRLTVDKIDTQAATREAEELGLSDKTFWLAATKYVEKVNPPKAAEATPPANPAKSVFDKASALNRLPDEPESKALEANTPPSGPAASPRNQDQAPAPTPVAVHDPSAWRSFAALMITGLTAPLAYMGRTALPSLWSAKRASLPAPERQPKSLPGASGD